MKKSIISLSFLILTSTGLFAQDTIKIQESAIGFCSVDGKIYPKDGSTSITDWTGTGFADPNNGKGISISWQVFIQTEGTYQFVWRYAFAGDSLNFRDARLLIDGNVVRDSIHFPFTDTTVTDSIKLKWSCWAISNPLETYLPAGSRQIRLEAICNGGLGNFDYFMVIGNAPTAIVCSNPSYVINVKSNNDDWGTVSCEPIQNYYEKGTQVTLRANANGNHFFESWTGEETSNDAIHSFFVNGNVNAVARFLPNGTAMDTNIVGYATVQDDKGTTYLITGGALGDSVQATTLDDLQSFLGDSLPHVIKFTGDLSGNAKVSVKSNKTLIGVGAAHLRGIGLSINQARNVIVRNMTISKVRDTLNVNDAIEINGGSKNIVIDHCDLYSDRDHDKDYYDGLLDIKNGSTFITVSWSALHDHYKACLISSGDEQFVDTVARLTFHHNYFYNCESRLPMIRFGRAHIFNNYYKDSHNAIDSRMGAWVRVERNYFDTVYRAVFDQGSAIDGKALLIDNNFGGSIVQALPACDWQIPYSYTLDPTENVPGIVTSNVLTDVVVQKNIQPGVFRLEQNYPNPFNPSTTIEFTIAEDGFTSLRIFDILGREVATLVYKKLKAGMLHQVKFEASKLTSGIYFSRLESQGLIQIKKLVLLR